MDVVFSFSVVPSRSVLKEKLARRYPRIVLITLHMASIAVLITLKDDVSWWPKPIHEINEELDALRYGKLSEAV